MLDHALPDLHRVAISLLFHHRKGIDPCPSHAADFLIPVAEGIVLSSRFYDVNFDHHRRRHFHGDGDCVSDADHNTIIVARLHRFSNAITEFIRDNKSARENVCEIHPMHYDLND